MDRRSQTQSNVCSASARTTAPYLGSGRRRLLLVIHEEKPTHPLLSCIPTTHTHRTPHPACAVMPKSLRLMAPLQRSTDCVFGGAYFRRHSGNRSSPASAGRLAAGHRWLGSEGVIDDTRCAIHNLEKCGAEAGTAEGRRSSEHIILPSPTSPPIGQPATDRPRPPESSQWAC